MDEGWCIWAGPGVRRMESLISYPQPFLRGREGKAIQEAGTQRQTGAISPHAYEPAGTLETFLGHCPDDLDQLLHCQLRFKHGSSHGLPLCVQA